MILLGSWIPWRSGSVMAAWLWVKMSTMLAGSNAAGWSSWHGWAVWSPTVGHCHHGQFFVVSQYDILPLQLIAPYLDTACHEPIIMQTSLQMLYYFLQVSTIHHWPRGVTGWREWKRIQISCGGKRGKDPTQLTIGSCARYLYFSNLYDPSIQSYYLSLETSSCRKYGTNNQFPMHNRKMPIRLLPTTHDHILFHCHLLMILWLVSFNDQKDSDECS